MRYEIISVDEFERRKEKGSMTSCKHCTYFSPNLPREDSYGECRVNPPTIPFPVIGEQSKSAIFPRIPPDYWCGKWKTLYIISCSMAD